MGQWPLRRSEALTHGPSRLQRQLRRWLDPGTLTVQRKLVLTFCAVVVLVGVEEGLRLTRDQHFGHHEAAAEQVRRVDELAQRIVLIETAKMAGKEAGAEIDSLKRRLNTRLEGLGVAVRGLDHPSSEAALEALRERWHRLNAILNDPARSEAAVVQAMAGLDGASHRLQRQILTADPLLGHLVPTALRVAQVMVLLVVLWLFANIRLTVIGPLRRVIAATRCYAAGDRSVRVEHPYPDELGELTGVLNRTADQMDSLIAQLETDRARLDEQQTQLRAIVQAAADGILMIDAAGRIVLANAAAAQIFGYGAGELTGREVEQLIPQGLQAHHRRLRDHYQRRPLARRIGDAGAHVRGRRKDGTHCELEISLSPVDWGQGAHVIAVIRDIGERRQVEADRARLAAIVEAAPDFIGIATVDGNVLYHNKAANELLGIEAGEAAQWRVGYSHTPDSAELLRTTGFPAAVREGSWHGETTLLTVEGEEIPVSQRLIAHYDDSGRVTHISTIARDLREVKRQEEALRLRGRAMALSSSAMVMVDARDPNRRVIDANPALEHLTGCRQGTLVGRDLATVLHSLGDLAGLDELEGALCAEALTELVLHGEGAEGTQVWYEVEVAPDRDAQGRVNHVVLAINDISAHKRYEAELEHRATHDALTELANRSLLRDRLEQALYHACRHDRAVGVVFVDLDNFKLINDSLGHETGDIVLQVMAARINGCVRSGDTVAREGGDEFAVVLSDVAEADDITWLTDRIQECLRQPIHAKGKELYITASIGVAVYPYDGDDVASLLMHADAAMYRAKTEERNTRRFFTEDMNRRASERLTLVTDLRRALEEGEFTIEYQPQVETTTRRIAAVEALLRWDHPTRGRISPAEFIPVAEEDGLVVPIGEWVLRQACEQVQRWREAELPGVRLSVNVSARQFRNPQFVETVRAALDHSGLPAPYLELEVTEGTLMRDVDHASRVIDRVKQMGVHLAVDDFGTGYSNLSYLKAFPIDKLKIDRMFIPDITHDTRDAAIAVSIINMAHTLGMAVVAEGVETEGQLGYLTRNRCDAVQGFYFSPPAGPVAIERLLEEGGAFGAATPHGDGRTLLIVDDEVNVIRALRRLLRNDGYRILSATSAEEAFELLAVEDVHVILADHRMPGMTGAEFLERVKSLYPDTIRMILSGYTDLETITDAVNRGAIYRFLTKPWEDYALRVSLLEAFKQHEMADENRRLSAELSELRRSGTTG